MASSVAEAMEDLRGLRRGSATPRQARRTHRSAGTHPFSRYEHQEVTDRPRYQELAEDIRWVAERELIFGLHVHVGLDSPETAIACSNGVRTFLPELLALSANSPFWQARPTGLASTRVKIFDMFPRSGLPPSFSSWAEFERMVERGIATNAFEDATFIWWDVRPHPKLGTIEIRVPDAQTRLDSVRALVALTQSLVAMVADRHASGDPLPVQPFTLVDENSGGPPGTGSTRRSSTSRTTPSGLRARRSAPWSSAASPPRAGSAARTTSRWWRGFWSGEAAPTSSAGSTREPTACSPSRSGSRRRPSAVCRRETVRP